MKNSIYLCLLCLVGTVLPGWAQFEVEHRGYGEFQVEEQVLLFGDRVNLRDVPSTQGGVVAQLPIAQSLTVKSVGEAAEINGLTMPWIEIETSYNGKPHRGWLWSGLVSHINRKGDDGELFLLGAKSGQGDLVRAEVRVIKAGKMLAQLDFPAIGGTEHFVGFKVSGNQGVNGILHVLQPFFFYEACGYTNGEANIFWDGQKMYDLGNTHSWSDAGVGYMQETYQFPADSEEGWPDRILWIKEDSENDEVGNGSMTRTSKALRWDGEKLVSYAYEYFLDQQRN